MDPMISDLSVPAIYFPAAPAASPVNSAFSFSTSAVGG